MRDPFVHAKEDGGNIREWLAGRRGARTVQVTVPDPIPVPQPADAVQAPQGVEVAADPELVPEPVEPVEPKPVPEPVEPVADPEPEPKPKNEAKKAEMCGHCNGPMPTFRSAGARYCSPACKGAARRRLDRLQPYYPD
jgi:outer membrane biosynthesis protein TonB